MATVLKWKQNIDIDWPSFDSMEEFISFSESLEIVAFFTGLLWLITL